MRSLIDRIPTPPELAQNPELASLASLRMQLEITDFALIAAHPELVSDPRPRLDPQAERGAALLRAIYRLGDLIARYERAARVRPLTVGDEDDLF